MKFKMAFCDICEEKFTIQPNGLMPYHLSYYRQGKGGAGMVLTRTCKGSWSKPTRYIMFEDENGT